MLVTLIDIRINIYVRKRRLIQPIQGNDQISRQGHIQKQMFILMFASICIFFLTILPNNLYKIIQAQENSIATVAVRVSTNLTILG